MPELIFSHDAVLGSKGNPWRLHISSGPNDIEWGYGLNTVTYPTYGGQVVQILSVYIDDITITGNVKSYRSMETIYRWFSRYMAAATSGTTGPTGKTKAGDIFSYNQVPVKMEYPERGWTFYIYPKALPGFIYSTETIAPQWTISAAVAEPDPELAASIKTIAEFNGIAEANDFYPVDGSPDAVPTVASITTQGKNVKTPNTGQGSRLLAALTKSLTPQLTINDKGIISTGKYSDPDADPNANKNRAKYKDYFHGLVDVYLKDDLPILQQDASKPYLDGKGTVNLDKSVTKESAKKKKKTKDEG